MKKFLLGAVITEVGLITIGGMLMKKMSERSERKILDDLCDIFKDGCDGCPMLDDE